MVIDDVFDKYSTEEYYNSAGIVMSRAGFKIATADVLKEFIVWFNKKDWEYKTDTHLDKIVSDFQSNSNIGDIS